MTDTNEIIRMAREAGFVSPSAAIHQLERFYQTAFEAGAAHEREACAKESLEVLENLRKETIAQSQQGMIEAYKLGQSEEREAIARMFDSSPKLMPYAQNAEGGCLACGFSAEYAAAVIRARGEK